MGGWDVLNSLSVMFLLIGTWAEGAILLSWTEKIHNYAANPIYMGILQFMVEMMLYFVSNYYQTILSY